MTAATDLLRTLGAFVLSAAFLVAPLHAEPTPPSAHAGATPPSANASAHAGATPIDDGGSTFEHFHGKPGVKRIAIDTVDRATTDPRIAHLFKGVDLTRLKRMLALQICYVAGGPCTYTGKDMKTIHADLGIGHADMGALVEDLQAAMDKEGVPFRAQNRLLAKLAPMKRDIVQR